MIDRLLARYRRLKRREQILAVVFTLIIAVAFYFRLLYKPLSRAIITYNFQTQKLVLRLDEMEGKTPQVGLQKAAIETLKAENDIILKEITDIEKKLPSEKNTAQLIGEFTRLAGNLKLVSIRQKMETGDEYSRIFVELKFNGKFADIVNYIRSLETISPFLLLEEMEVSQLDKKEALPGMPVRLVVSSLLGETPFAEELRAKEEKREASTGRDIFVSRSRPAAAAKSINLKLEGITYNAVCPTAIINNEVVKLGAKIGNLEVKEILHDTVVLTDGIQDQLLSVER